MKTTLFLFLLLPFLGLAQVQLGQDISGLNQNDFAGWSVSLSSDGNIVAIGAPENQTFGSGYVRVYKNVNNSWFQIGQDIYGETSYSKFGHSVSLSANGEVLAIGAPGNDNNGIRSGFVRIYKNINDTWIQIGQDIEGENNDDNLGWSVSLSDEGNIIAIGAPYVIKNGITVGSTSLYRNNNDSWVKIGETIYGEHLNQFYDGFGKSTSLSSDGTTVAIGAPTNSISLKQTSNKTVEKFGYVIILKNINNIWTKIGETIFGDKEGDQIGRSISLSSNGEIIAIGSSSGSNNYGHVRIYKNISNIWTQIGDDILGEAYWDLSGLSVSLSSDGNIVAIGAPHNDSIFGGGEYGHVRIYKNINNLWTQIGKDIDGKFYHGNFGTSVSLSDKGNCVAVGASGNTTNFVNSGSVSIYDLTAVLSTESFNYNYFSYYPNPVKDILNIDLNSGLTLKQVNIYNMQSQYLYSVKTSKIDVSNLASGMYFIEVETDKGKSAKKIIIE